MNNELTDEEIIEILTFYAEQNDEKLLSELSFPENKLKYDEKEMRSLLVYSPLFTIEEKKVVLMQMPYMKQKEFDDIVVEIKKAHETIKTQLAKLEQIKLSSAQSEAKEALEKNL